MSATMPLGIGCGALQPMDAHNLRCQMDAKTDLGLSAGRSHLAEPLKTAISVLSRALLTVVRSCHGQAWLPDLTSMRAV